MVKKEEFTFDSRDGKTKLHAVRWVPEGKVICILQIIHGMAEYIERYEPLAQFLGEKGILVTGDDHLGHGKSVEPEGTYGYFCEQDPATVVVRDVHRLKKMTQEDYPGIPYVILGHSMGSFILRNYLFRYGTGIEGAIICGTGSKPQALVKFCKIFAALQGAFLGDKHVAKLLDKLAFGNYNSRIPDAKTGSDWLCTEEQIVDNYVKDELCGFIFTVNGFKTLFELLNRLNKTENLCRMPKELPVLFIAGDMDPVGDYGKGVRKAYEDFMSIGMERISLKLYPGGRHEILNEKNKQQVYEDIYPWIMERAREYRL
ncbi:MAG: lysophospholipase [Lachnospiraceae bacterium]|nr:lysophospholipase [Lachnospiraceae bacterium]MDY5869522.1 alpha/beta fold hydrolase [Lachnospiraceae bacterium]